MAPLVLVLLDGLGSSALSCMGSMEALTRVGRARFTELCCELPALSRPIYHCLLTGLPPAVSGMLHNDDWTPHPAPTLFSRAREAGLVTAAAAYGWISELCNRAPFDAARDRLTEDAGLPIMHGLFYTNDAYPDDHVFMDAEALRRRYAPQLLLVHTMGVDFAGHGHGADSAAYRNAARQVDMLLARFVPCWLEAGCNILITSDHGMSPDGLHNGSTDAERRVPFWALGPACAAMSLPVRQTECCSCAARLLKLPC